MWPQNADFDPKYDYNLGERWGGGGGGRESDLYKN